MRQTNWKRIPSASSAAGEALFVSTARERVMQQRRMMESGYAPVEGGELYYETLGEGPVIVLIHAAVADHRMWEDQFYLFGESHRVVRYDGRGFGKSRTADDEFSDRQDLAELMDHLGIEKAHLIGNSRGGQLAIEFALQFPERVLS